ncbi:MAG: hypothetical protein R3C01_03890 [Planctomycetaceae bacterium]
MNVLALWLPILLASIAMFFVSFLSWMILQLHKADWGQLPDEAEFLKRNGELNLPVGNYMFPMAQTSAEMQSDEFQAKWKAGPRGVLSIFPLTNMGRNLALTMLYFLAVNFTVGYLATIAFPNGAEFLQLFRFVATASLLGLIASITQHAIWFRCRITGHIIESIVYSLIAAALFASLWPTT